LLMVYRNNTGRLGCWLHQCVLRNTLAGSKTVVSTSLDATVCMNACMPVNACMYVCMHVRTYARACMYVCIHACTCVCAYLYLGQWQTVTRLFQHLENKTHVSETNMHTRSRGFSLSLPLPFSLCHYLSLPFRSPWDPVCARSVPLFFKRVMSP